MNSHADRILKSYRLRSTPTRKEILEVLLKKGYALSHTDIEKAVDSSFDRVTVYRTLRTFLDKGLIHKVLDDGGVLKYALCTDSCNISSHKHEHVHFKCTNCQQTSCLKIEIPAVKLPVGYKAKELNLLIQGLCKSCFR